MTVTFLVDVDNTLLDNDRIRVDFRAHVAATYGVDARDHYWEIQERRFIELGCRDYLGAVEEWSESREPDPREPDLAAYLLDYPFAERLFPGALDVLARLRGLGATVVLTDGDAIFQPHKVRRSGIRDAVDGHVLVYVHKDKELDDVERRYPSDRYVFVDDKPTILAAAKEHWRERVTTVLPIQGQFAKATLEADRADADLTVDRIADLLEVTF